MNQEDIDETKVILRFGYNLKLVVRMKTALTIMATLSEENILMSDTTYSSGKSVEFLKPWGTEDISIALISHAQLLVQCAAAPEVK